VAVKVNAENRMKKKMGVENGSKQESSLKVSGLKITSKWLLTDSLQYLPRAGKIFSVF